MARNASPVLIPDQTEIDLSQSPLSFYGIDEKHIRRGYMIFCANCNKVEKDRKSFKVCSKCKRSKTQKYDPMYHHYCSKQCQKEHWKIHRLEHNRLAAFEGHLLINAGGESEDQKAERNDTLPDDPLVKTEDEGSIDKNANKACDEFKVLAKTVTEATQEKVAEKETVPENVMCDRASSPIGEHQGMPDKVHFNLSAGTSSARFCLGQKITRTEGGVNKSTVALLKQETGPDGTVRATTTPVYEEDIIIPKKVWKQAVPMGKHPSKNLQDRGGKKDAATSPPQKDDLKAVAVTKNGKKVSSASKSSRKSGRGSGKFFKKGEETVLDVSEVPPSKVSSEPFWKPNGEAVGRKSLPPTTSVDLNGTVTALPAHVSLKSSMTGLMSGSEQEDEEPKESPKQVAKAKPKKKKEHEVKDVSSLSNKYVTVVDVNECPPLESKHYVTDSSSSGDDAGGYMMYIITDEVDGTRSAVVQKRKNKRKRNFNPRILFEKDHMKKKRSLPRKDGKPRQEVTFHFSHSSDEEDGKAAKKSGGTSSSTDLKAITNIMQSATSQTKDKSTGTSKVEKSSKADKAAKDGKSTAALKTKEKAITGQVSEAKTQTAKGETPSKSSESKGGKTAPTEAITPTAKSKTPAKSSDSNGGKAAPTAASTPTDKGTTPAKGGKAAPIDKTAPKASETTSGEGKTSKATEAKSDASKGKSKLKGSEGGSEKPAKGNIEKTEASKAKVEVLTPADKEKSGSKSATANESQKPVVAAQSSQKEVKSGAEVALSGDNAGSNVKKTKFDPGIMVQSVCKKINVAFAEEMPRPSRIVEVTASDDEIEQAVLEKSTGQVDKILKRNEKKSQGTQNAEVTSAKDDGEGVKPSNPSEKVPSETLSDKKFEDMPDTSVTDAMSTGDGKEDGPLESAEEHQNNNNSNGKSTLTEDQSKGSSTESSTVDSDEYGEDSRKLDAIENTLMKALVNILVPTTAVEKSYERRDFVLKNGGFAGQDLEVSIRRTRDTPAQDPALEENCCLRYYVSRKMKIPSKKDREASQNDATFFRGKEAVIKKSPSVDHGEWEADQFAKKDTVVPSDEKPLSSVEDRKAPLVEYDMSSQTKSESAEPDLRSTGKFRVLNSDKEFGDIYSDESIAQLSNPSVDVSEIFDTDPSTATEVTPKEKHSAPVDDTETKQSETATHLDDVSREARNSETTAFLAESSREKEKADLSAPGDEADEESEKLEAPAPLNETEKPNKAPAAKKTTPVKLFVQSAPYMTSLCERPQYPTTIILKKGAFGFLVATEGEYRIFTHVYAKKKWSDEEVEGK